MHTFVFNMPKSLEKEIKKKAKKSQVSPEYKTELSFTLNYFKEWFVVSNWGIIMPFPPDRKGGNLTQRDFDKIRYGRMQDKAFFYEGSWGSFEIEFLKDNKFFIKEGNGHNNKTFNSFSHISEMATDINDEIRYFHFQDDGYIKIFKNIYKRYN